MEEEALRLQVSFLALRSLIRYRGARLLIDLKRTNDSEVSSLHARAELTQDVQGRFSSLGQVQL